MIKKARYQNTRHGNVFDVISVSKSHIGISSPTSEGEAVPKTYLNKRYVFEQALKERLFVLEKDAPLNFVYIVDRRALDGRPLKSAKRAYKTYTEAEAFLREAQSAKLDSVFFFIETVKLF